MKKNAGRCFVSVRLPFALMALALLQAGGAEAQSEPELVRLLKYFEGRWEIEGTTFAPVGGKRTKVPLTGRLECEVILNGRWLRMENIESFAGAEHPHLTLVSWDSSKQTIFRRVFTDSSYRHPREEGRWIDPKTFEFAAEFDWDDGNRYGFRNIYERQDDGTLHYTMFQNVNGGRYFPRTQAILRRASE